MTLQESPCRVEDRRAQGQPTNTATTDGEPAFIEAYGAALGALGHEFIPVAEIGAATGIEYLPGGLVLAAAEPGRPGGGSAGVVHDVLGSPEAPGTDDPRLAPNLGDD